MYDHPEGSRIMPVSRESLVESVGGDLWRQHSMQSTWCLQIKRNHVGLSDQLLRIMRALDALEGRFAEASNHHSSRTHQVHESLSHDLSQLEAVLAPNSAGKPVILCGV